MASATHSAVSASSMASAIHSPLSALRNDAPLESLLLRNETAFFLALASVFVFVLAFAYPRARFRSPAPAVPSPGDAVPVTEMDVLVYQTPTDPLPGLVPGDKTHWDWSVGAGSDDWKWLGEMEVERRVMADLKDELDI